MGILVPTAAQQSQSRPHVAVVRGTSRSEAAVRDLEELDLGELVARSALH